MGRVRVRVGNGGKRVQRMVVDIVQVCLLTDIPELKTFKSRPSLTLH
jgi:hypothetical protein